MQDLSVGLSTPVPENASLAERAYYELRDRIVSLRLRPGELVREEMVMEDLGISRTPVREALLRLAQERLVAIIPRRGTFVTEVHVGDVGTVYEFRRELEAIAAGWAAERRTEADFEQLDAMIAEMAEIPEIPSPGVDARSQMSLDQRAHNLVYSLSRNPLIEHTLQSYYFLAARIWFLASGRVTMHEPFTSLIDVLRSVRDGDADAAREHARVHSKAAESAIRAAL